MKRELLEPKATKGVRNTPSPISGQQQVAAISSVQRFLQLQRTIGNRAVQRLIQTKLQVSQPDDVYEREADHVAEHVMQMPEPQGALVQAKVGDDSEIQRQTDEPEEEEEETPVQTQQEGGHAPQPTSILEAQLGASKGHGQSLSESDRSFFESRFGYDFSRVNIHTDAAADSLNRDLQARAFTTDQDIYFRQGEYHPSSSTGRALLAHELTHVVQQNGFGGSARPQAVASTPMPMLQTKLRVSEPNDQFEQEADRVADEVIRMPDSAVTGAASLEAVGHGSDEHSTSRPPSIQRLCTDCAAKKTVPVDWWIGYEQGIGPDEDLASIGHANRVLVVDNFNVLPTDKPECRLEGVQGINDKTPGVTVPIVPSHEHPKGTGGRISVKARLVERGSDTTPQAEHKSSFPVNGDYDKVRKKTGMNEVIIKFVDRVETQEITKEEGASTTAGEEITGTSGTSGTVGASATQTLHCEIKLGVEAGVEGTASFEVAPKIIETLGLEVGGEINATAILAILGLLAAEIPPLAAMLEGIAALGLGDGIKGNLQGTAERGYELALTFGAALTANLKGYLEGTLGGEVSGTISYSYTWDNSTSVTGATTQITSTSTTTTITEERRREAVPVGMEIR